MYSIGRNTLGSVNIALVICIIERRTFTVHRPRPRLFDTAGGQQDLTERRLASGFDENQTFVAIFYSCVLKMQHSDGWIVTPSVLSSGGVQLSLSRARCAVSADRPDHLSKKHELRSFRADLC